MQLLLRCVVCCFFYMECLLTVTWHPVAVSQG